jgi:GT2 family glycosyltransferase
MPSRLLVQVPRDRSGLTLGDITAVVCTRNRPVFLARSLKSLLRQRQPPREILVVDNAPDDDSTLRLVQQTPGIRYVREPVAGLDFARNRALQVARGSVVAFLDDDAVAGPGWIAAIQAAFDEHPQAAVCTGRVEPLCLDTDAQRLFEANGGFSRGMEQIRLPADVGRPLHGRRVPLVAWATRIGIGCNLAVRRDAALDVGGFDVALDLGTALPGGGDLDIVWQLLQGGHEAVYIPGVLVYHEHRRELSAVLDQIIGHQRALIAFLAKAAYSTSGGRRLPILAFLGWRLMKPGVRLARRFAGRDPLGTKVLLRMWWNCWMGMGAYAAARRTARRRVFAAKVPA